MKLKLFRRKPKVEKPVIDTRIDARDHQWIHGQQPRQYLSDPMIPLRLAGLRKVPKWCRCGREGKTILCPECGGVSHVYHFSWDALKCGSCSADIEKYDWYLAASTDDDK
jgi:hypothetical protein